MNPTDGILREMCGYKIGKPKKRKPLTREEQDILVNYVKNSYRHRNWLPVITLFLGTGMRAGEVTGLTWNDVDFENNVIHVTHSLSYSTDIDGRCRFIITTPKTDDGMRDIPIVRRRFCI